jgi:hypothetical protein
MNLIEFAGLRRSGNHAIIFWMLQNLSGKKEVITIENRVFYRSGNCIFFNNLNNESEFFIQKYLKSRLNIKLGMNNIRWLVASYEDCNAEYSFDFNYEFEKRYKFSIVRDIQNIFSSRLKLLEQNDIEISPGMNIYDNTFNDYVSLKNYENPIIFEKWLIDKDYRNSICKKIGVSNLDITDYVSDNGGGSSFTKTNMDTKENLLNRKNMYKIPDKYLNKIKELNL